MKLKFGNKSPLRVVFFLYAVGTTPDARKICCRVWIKRTKAELFLNVTCKESDWDEGTQRCYPTSKQLQHLNYQLSNVEEKFEEIYNNMINQGIEPTPKKLRDAFRGKSVEDIKKYKLLEFIDVFIEEIKKKKDEYGPETIKKYFALKRHLTSFFGTLQIKDIELGSLSRAMLDRFETYLLTTPHATLGYPMNRNTCNLYLVKLKTVTNNAMRKEIIRKNPFFGFKIKQVKPKKVFLTMEEVRQIENHSLVDNLALKRVRDIFLFTIYTGLRHSDAMALKVQDVFPGEGSQFWIQIDQVKTDEPLLIPLLKPAEMIFLKYKKLQEKTGMVLPRLSNQKMNNHLKEIAALVGIRKNITSHVGRHTFATTIAMENGLDIKTVSKWLGHASIKTTEVYAQVTKKHLSDTAAALNQKLTPEIKPEIIKDLIKASNTFLN